MKKYSLLLFASMVIIGCKKDDLSKKEALQEIQGTLKADAPGNLHTRILNNTLNFAWEILWGPDNFIWFTEWEGRVKRMNPETDQVIMFAIISEVTSTTNFNGLLGMALHPQFDSNPYVYLVYNYFGVFLNGNDHCLLLF